MIDVNREFTIHPKAAAPIVHAIGYTLEDVYGSYSVGKLTAYKYCKWLCEQCNGYDFCITSANTFMFTASFEFINPDDNRHMRAIITRTYNHAYYLE